ncbi:MAG: hypothetical protein JW774_05075 [Candidatus Aureabacteria bacterium]|nr:hypothetical protein [Candidatus Auribacterota bacterium]
MDTNGDGKFEKIFPIENGRVLFPDESPGIPAVKSGPIIKPRTLAKNQILFSGIMTNNSQHQALINDEIFTAGAMINNYVIREINDNQVILVSRTNPSKQIILPLGTVVTVEDN